MSAVVDSPSSVTRYQITVTGVVQGVGFRPFVKRLADRFGLRGIVRNTAAGVDIDIETEDQWQVAAFQAALRGEAPSISRIESCTLTTASETAGYTNFQIAASAPTAGSFTLTSPDIATCSDCLREILDPADRRFGYPFTNCTNCGPRYSITRRVPYDRANTTMEKFAMCPACSSEYAGPLDRRFHAEPNACPNCGPRLSVPLDAAIEALQGGRIVALKGLGGFQLACDAHCAEAVDKLRERKRRSRKPFAVMMADPDTVDRYCHVSAPQRVLLTGSAAPIVLLETRQPQLLPDGIAPGLHEIGVMLPYTPLHHLLFAKGLRCLVMTSGNVSEEPIVISNEEAQAKLALLADMLLLHDRDIFMRVDDSVVRAQGEGSRVLRRARGYAPAALDLGFESPEVLACGGELKNTFCLTKGNYAILSQHIGDLENFETLQFFEETLGNLKQVYRAEPRIIAHDLHPDYLTTRWASRQPEPKIAVQHHHAHIASCMAENGCRERVIGVAFDGTGYGTDGQIWGGEFLLCDNRRFERAAHLRYVPLIGGDRAARDGWRMAAAHLFDAFGPDYRKVDLPLFASASTPVKDRPGGPQASPSDLIEKSPGRAWAPGADQKVRPTSAQERRKRYDIGPGLFQQSAGVFDQLLAHPAQLMTSSCGRLFDAVAALTGICHSSSYEGEAAMLLESVACSDDAEPYPFTIGPQIDTRPMVKEIVRQAAAGVSAGRISAAFHATLAAIVESACVRLREENGIGTVCLSGGTFQNCTLLDRAAAMLERRGFRVLTQSRVPPNDGGLSLGQAAIAATYLKDMS